MNDKDLDKCLRVFKKPQEIFKVFRKPIAAARLDKYMKPARTGKKSR